MSNKDCCRKILKAYRHKKVNTNLDEIIIPEKDAKKEFGKKTEKKIGERIEEDAKNNERADKEIELIDDDEIVKYNIEKIKDFFGKLNSRFPRQQFSSAIDIFANLCTALQDPPLIECNSDTICKQLSLVWSCTLELKQGSRTLAKVEDSSTKDLEDRLIYKLSIGRKHKINADWESDWESDWERQHDDIFGQFMYNRTSLDEVIGSNESLALLLAEAYPDDPDMYIGDLYGKDRIVRRALEQEMGKRMKRMKKIKKTCQGEPPEPIECPVCLEENIAYHVLPCTHHICVDCITELPNKNKTATICIIIECPMCRKELVLEEFLKTSQTIDDRQLVVSFQSCLVKINLENLEIEVFFLILSYSLFCILKIYIYKYWSSHLASEHSVVYTRRPYLRANKNGKEAKSGVKNGATNIKNDAKNTKSYLTTVCLISRRSPLYFSNKNEQPITIKL